MNDFNRNLFRAAWAVLLCLVLTACATPPQQTVAPSSFQFVFTSDSHFGITRKAFRGASNVDANIVNAALVDELNGLPAASIPCDGGVRACSRVGAVDFLIDTGDLANRMEDNGPSAAASWQQFETQYLGRLALRDADGKAAAVYLAPGNHDVSNAIGFYKPMTLDHDATSQVQIYNRMMHPASPSTTENYRYAAGRVNYSKDIGGVHFVFLNIWPDSVERAWLEQDLAKIGEDTPVLIFTHDPPSVEAKHFINPNGSHDINAHDKFENLLADELADRDVRGQASVEAQTLIEQRELAGFLKRHRNVIAYFHGHTNYNEYYTWSGPDKDVALRVFRVDSPMKGEVSAKDEKKLSFQLVSVDPQTRRMTVREYLWNAHTWGDGITVSLQPR